MVLQAELNIQNAMKSVSEALRLDVENKTKVCPDIISLLLCQDSHSRRRVSHSDSVKAKAKGKA